MCCFAALFAWISPRLAIVMVWLFTNRMSVAFESFWIATLGFFILPWTTLAWAVCYATPTFTSKGGVTGFGWIVVGFALFVDIASYTSGARAQRQRSAIA